MYCTDIYAVCMYKLCLVCSCVCTNSIRMYVVLCMFIVYVHWCVCITCFLWAPDPTVPRNVTLVPRSDISVEWFLPEVLGDDYVTYRATIQSVCGMTNVTTNGSSASFETSDDPEGVMYRLGVLAFNSVGESPEVVLMHSTQRGG